MASISYRPLQLAGLLKREITMVLHNKIKDSRLNRLVVTDVEVSKGYSHAKVYISIPEHEDEQHILKVITGASGFIRGSLSSSLVLKFVPKLSFKIDNSYQQGNRIDEILNDTHR